MNEPAPLEISGRVLALWLKRAKSGPMDPVDRAELVAARGIRNNANQGGRRQVTLLDIRRWKEAEADLGAEVDPRFRRANVFTEGIDYRQTRGRILQLGTCRVRILGETRPCTLMDEMFPGLQRALDPDWRAGAFAEILDGGQLAVGDSVTWEPATDDAPAPGASVHPVTSLAPLAPLARDTQ